MSGLVGWIGKEYSIQVAVDGLALAMTEAYKRGKRNIMRSEGNGLATVSMVAFTEGKNKLSDSETMRVFLNDSGFVVLKGLVAEEVNIVSWAHRNGLGVMSAHALLAHVTAAEIVDETMHVPGPAVLIDKVAGAPVGEMTRYSIEVLKEDPSEVDITFDSGARFVEHVAWFMSMGLDVQQTLQYIAHSTDCAIHSAFIEWESGEVGLINTPRSAGNRNFPNRMWYAGVPGEWVWANDASVVDMINPHVTPVEVPEGEVKVLS